MSVATGPAALEPWLARAVFASVGAFIAEHALSPAFADAATHAVARDSRWRAHWPALRRRPSADPRIGLCFVLACDLLGLDADRGLALASEAAHPERWMRLFLADHGLMAYDAFDDASRARPGSASGPTRTSETAVSPRRTTRARAPRRAATPA